jgi:hypothetical protein
MEPEVNENELDIKTLVQDPLPNEEDLDEFLADILALESQPDDEVELDDEDNVVGPESDMSEEPPPTEGKLDSMLSEIRELEQDECLVNEEVEQRSLYKSSDDEL